ncbi:PLP-dependent transferase [Xylaria sp. FL1777]|nr:PLP-dependent transferase [Xylaria sp. FL1777]
MVKIPVFEVERWMDEYENTPGVVNIAETCASSISISQLSGFHRNNSAAAGSAPSVLDFSPRMTYGAIRGSDELRRNIAALYAEESSDDAAAAAAAAVVVTPEDVIVSQGAIAANHLVFYTLVGPGDHVVCVYPTYQQLYAIPETLGAEVSLWKLRAEDQYVPDVGELEKLIKSNTKMIVINNPNNPTGATTPKAVLSQIIEVARARGIVVFSDEVYRPLFHSPATTTTTTPPPPSALALGYDKVVVTSSMSKAWSLAGIRVGWAACRDRDIVARLAGARDYTTISVSQLDDQVARYALSADVRHGLLERNVELARANLALLEGFVGEHADVCSWVRPTAGSTAFIRFARRDGQPVDDEAFAKDLIRATKVLVVPGGLCFGDRRDFRGYVRIGYVGDTEELRKGLGYLSAYVAENLK